MIQRSILLAAVALSVLTVPGAAQQVLLSENFTAGAGWILDTGTEWAIGPAVASSGGTGSCAAANDPGSDAEGVPGGGLAGVVIGGNAATGMHPMDYITSPPVNTTVVTSPTLCFERWLVSDYTSYMQNNIEVFDGITWQIIWQSGASPGIQDTAWNPQTFDLTPYTNQVLQVRFGFDVGNTGVFTCPSWSIDNVQIADSPCPPFGTSVFGLSMSSPFGAGSIQLDNVGGSPLAPFVTLLTPHQGNFPNGATAGLDISPHEVSLQLGYGIPPFVGTLDLGGTSSYLAGPGTLPVGITLYGVSAELDVTGTYPVLIGSPTSFLVP